jgi:bifunctional DNase/RNase
MTHDLLKLLVDRLGGKVEKIIIDDLWQDTYYAKITISTNKGASVQEIDARPSDAIALALREKAPIFMAESVLEQAAVGDV